MRFKRDTLLNESKRLSYPLSGNTAADGEQLLDKVMHRLPQTVRGRGLERLFVSHCYVSSFLRVNGGQARSLSAITVKGSGHLMLKAESSHRNPRAALAS